MEINAINCKKIPITSKQQWLDLRSEDITSTDCSALFGLSKYKTLFELWHEKKNKTTVSFDENERMKWGSRLESVIAKGVAEDKNWTVQEMKDYYRASDKKIGSSFDFFINEEQAILEIKNVDGLIYRNEWTDDEAPPHIELQVQHQLAVTGLKCAYLCALVGGNEVKLIKRSRDENIISAIYKKVSEFWLSIDKNEPPAPDYERDAEYIISMNQFAEPEKIYSGDTTEIEQLASEHARLGKEEKEISIKREAIKARCLQILGDCEKLKSSKFSISAGIVGEKTVSYTTKPYRNFKVFIKKED